MNDKTYRAVIKKVTDSIIEGELKHGDWLMPERELAEKLDVSRNAVREGLKTLEYMDVIEVVKGKGSVIKDIKPDIVSDIWTILLTQDGASLTDMIEVREIIEVSATQMATLRRTDSDLLKIEYYLKRMYIKDLSTAEKAENDVAFHRSIIEATHNPLLIHVYKSINESITKYMSIISSILSQSLTENELNEEHKAIFEAIRDEDVDKAKTTSAQHIKSIIEQIKQ